jgi:hypothetical protein
MRELFAAEPGLTPEGAERLKALCREEITQLRVRTPIPKRTVRAPAGQVGRESETLASAADTATAVAERTEQAPAPDAGRREADRIAEPPAVAPEPVFDPYAFSLVALLKRSGRQALLSRLGEIDSSSNLHKLADAQHIALSPGIVGLADLREAIADGAEQRLADRRAAAS